MAGHSKWKNIQNRKSSQDCKKAQVYGKFSREIMTAAIRDKNPETNLNLKTIIHLAKKNKIPNEVIEKAIKSADKALQGEEVLYEAFLPNGIALLVKGFTDNKARTITEVRSTINKAGGNMGPCLYMFEHLGYISLKASVDDILDIENLINFEENEDEVTIFFPPEKMADITNKLAEKYEILDKDIIYLARDKITTTDSKIEDVLDKLETLGDVSDVYTNIE